MTILYFILTLITGFGLGIIWGAYHHERYVVDEELEELIVEDDEEDSDTFPWLFKWSSRSHHHED
jgi:hypothetical protein